MSGVQVGRAIIAKERWEWKKNVGDRSGARENRDRSRDPEIAEEQPSVGSTCRRSRDA